jgi:hypothetical protein
MNTKTVFFLSFFFVINFQLFAQDSLKVNSHHFSLKLSGALVNGASTNGGNQLAYIEQKPQLGISLNYQFLKNFNSGLSIAHVNGNRSIPIATSEYGTSYSVINSSLWYYGLNFSYDILPLIFITNHIRFDVYPIISLNYVRENWNDIDTRNPDSTIFWEYSGGIGLGYNFNRHFGIFTESLFGKFYNYDKFQLKAGFKYKF